MSCDHNQCDQVKVSALFSYFIDGNRYPNQDPYFVSVPINVALHWIAPPPPSFPQLLAEAASTIQMRYGHAPIPAGFNIALTTVHCQGML